MPMLYKPGPGDVVTFKGLRGVLVPAISEGYLYFIEVSDDGNVNFVKEYGNKPSKFFDDAVIIDRSTKFKKGFRTAVNGIIITVNAASLNKIDPY